MGRPSGCSIRPVPFVAANDDRVRTMLWMIAGVAHRRSGDGVRSAQAHRKRFVRGLGGQAVRRWESMRVSNRSRNARRAAKGRAISGLGRHGGKAAAVPGTPHSGPHSTKTLAGFPGGVQPLHEGEAMTEQLTGWETTRLSKHFILLDFLADHEVYRQPGRRVRERLRFEEIWNDEHDALAKGLCNDLLEPLMMDERFGPISIADAFWPSVFKLGHYQSNPSCPNKHRWAGGEATVDIALYRLVGMGMTGCALGKVVKSIEAIDGCLDRVISYPQTEFVCVTFKPEGAKKGQPLLGKRKTQNLRAHHVRVGHYFNLLDFCRNGQALEKGIDLVPKNAENKDPAAYRPIPEETAARSFAAALDPLVEELGRVSVVRGMETSRCADAEHAELHRWDRDGPWRLVFVLPQGADPERACHLLKACPHFREVEPSHHASDSYSLALIVDQNDYDEHRGLRLGDPH